MRHRPASAVRDLGLVFLALQLAWPAPHAVAAPADSFTVPQLRQDLVTLEAAIRDTHPNLRHSVDPSTLSSAIRALDAQIDQPRTRDEAWAAFATLNPLLADGHLFVGFDDWRGDTEAHLAAGGTLFPFEVHVTPDQRVFVRAQLGGAESVFAGARVRSINGVDAGVIVATLLARVHGDTPQFRADLLSRRWWLYYWKLYGAATQFDFTLDDPAGTHIHAAGSRHLPAVLVTEASFGAQFQFSPMPCETALLTARAFSWSDEPQFLQFTREAFTRMRELHVRHLIIDVRDNSGGDDDFWKRGILPYLATKPYRWGSTYEKRVLDEFRDAGEKTGEVVSGSIEDWIAPEPGNPVHFSGDVYVLIGPATYSSAILFANVMREFGFGVLAGSGGSARADQTGSTQKRVLPNTGLVVWSPRFILKRPSGASEPLLLEPDIPIDEDPFHPPTAVSHLLAHIGGGSCVQQ